MCLADCFEISRFSLDLRIKNVVNGKEHLKCPNDIKKYRHKTRKHWPSVRVTKQTDQWPGALIWNTKINQVAIKRRKLISDKTSFLGRGCGETQSVINGVKETNAHICMFIWKHRALWIAFRWRLHLYTCSYTHTYTYVYPSLYTNAMSRFRRLTTALRCLCRS